jgi:DNA-binding response OmpR family regulator
MNSQSIHILYVEDDPNLSMVVVDFLHIHNYEVSHFLSAEKALSEWCNDYDICVLDIMLPGMDGYELALKIRELNQNIPLIFLSAKSQTNDKIKGLELGADDYLCKPFSTIELDLRIKAILKRSLQNHPKIAPIEFKLGKIEYSANEMTLLSGNQLVVLTKKENELLKLLIANKNQIVSREQILMQIWGEVNKLNSRSMDVYLTKIRKHLSIEPQINILNYHGTGFKFDTENS